MTEKCTSEDMKSNQGSPASLHMNTSTENIVFVHKVTKVSCSKTFFSVNSVYTMFSVLMFMCRDPGDTTSKVSCCVESS